MLIGECQKYHKNEVKALAIQHGIDPNIGKAAICRILKAKTHRRKSKSLKRKSSKSKKHGSKSKKHGSKSRKHGSKSKKHKKHSKHSSKSKSPRKRQWGSVRRKHIPDILARQQAQRQHILSLLERTRKMPSVAVHAQSAGRSPPLAGSLNATPLYKSVKRRSLSKTPLYIPRALMPVRVRRAVLKPSKTFL